MGANGAPIMTQTNNLLYPYPVVNRSIALGSTTFSPSDNPSTTSTTSALIFLNGDNGNASISGKLTLRGGDSIIETQTMSQLTIGSVTTGPIQLSPKGTTGLFVDSVGDVGIGTTAPIGRLHVSGAVTGKALTILDASGDQNILAASSSGVTKLTLDQSGDLSIAGYFSALSSANTSIRASGTGVGSTGNGSIYFQNSTGATTARFDTTDKGLNPGDGSDGSLTVSSGTTTINDDSGAAYGEKAISSTAASGQAVVPVATTSNLATGDEVLVIQMTGDNAGSYEFHKITTVTTNTSVTLDDTLTHNYTKDSTSSGQIVEVPQFTDVTITGGNLTAPAWNGSIGGIIIFRATGTFSCQSNNCINAAGIGYRGGTSLETGSAKQGENVSGSQTGSNSHNFNGGGGGSRSTAGSGGGGGAGYISSTAGSGTSPGGAARPVMPMNMSRLFMGGGGGAGGDDSDVAGVDGGAGGTGGGILYIEATKVLVGSSGRIDTSGNNGSNGASNDGGGGGGGAGGAAWIRANQMDLLNSLTSRTIGAGGGGNGGTASGTGAAGGAGSAGFTKIDAAEITGSNNDSSSSETTDHGTLNKSYGTFHIGKLDTQNADVAELYTSTDALEPGDIVTIPESSASSSLDVAKVRSNDQPIIGAVSTEPGMVLGSLDVPQNTPTYPIALNGRTPIRVTSAGGTIKRGDPIMLSTISGFGQKATQPGYIVGYALSDFDPDTSLIVPCPVNLSGLECGSVMTFIQPRWYDPTELSLTQLSVNQLNNFIGFATSSADIASSSANPASLSGILTAITKPLLSATTAFFTTVRLGTATITGVLTAPTIQVHGLTADSITIQGKSLREYILENIQTTTPDHSATTTAALTHDASASGSLSIATLFHDLSISNVIHFISQVFFYGQTNFAGPVAITHEATISGQLTLPDNMAGSAIIRKYTKSVDVTFPEAFSQTPTVTFSLVSTSTDSAFMTDGLNAFITNTTPQGFSIILDSLAIRDYTYNWIAISVRNKTTTSSHSPFDTGIYTDKTMIATDTAVLSASASAQTDKHESTVSATPAP
jgi:hypothetical protein